LLLLALCFTATWAKKDWSSVDKILQNGINTQVYPGCVAIVGDADNIYYSKSFGSYTYGLTPPYTCALGSNPPMTADTIFDMASLTKVVGTTVVAAKLYEMGFLPLNTPLSDPSLLGPNFNNNGKGPITVLNCLLHNAGFPADPSPSYNSVQFGCPETSQQYPQEVFSCRSMIFQSVLNQTLQNPVGAVYLYSDLSMITLMFAVGNVVRNQGLVAESDVRSDCLAAGTGPDAAACYYEAYLRVNVYGPLGMTNTGHLPDQSEWCQCAPAENGTNGSLYMNIVAQGQVSDENAYALGGIAGHAGLFSTPNDLITFMRAYMYGSTLLQPSTVQLFIKEYNQTQSSRALGWNTNDPVVTDQGTNFSCGDLMSPLTFMHTGYTGTMICGDPNGNYFTILMTNRVYPTDSTGSSGIHAVREAFGDAVVGIMGP